MGDAKPHPTSAGEFPGQDAVTGDFTATTSNESRTDDLGQGQLSPDAQHNLQPQQFTQQYGGAQQHAFASQFDTTQPLGPGRPGPYNMNAMMNALPQAHYGRGQYAVGNQRYSSGGTPLNSAGQMQPTTQFPLAQAAAGGFPNQQFYLPQHTHMQQYYSSPVPASQQHGNMSPRTAISYYSGQMAVNNQQGPPQAVYYYPQATHFHGQPHGMPPQMVAGQYLSSTPPQTDPRSGRHHGGDPAGRTAVTQSQEHGQGAPSDGRSNIVRGPPRKPKQSGHAIWIGNLPPQTDLMNLVHHVCTEAAGLESLFLISKSNCAFANFKDEQSCVAAQQKLHDSKFQSVRLVSRLRKSAVEGASGLTAPTGPAASTAQQPSYPERSQDQPGEGRAGGVPAAAAAAAVAEPRISLPAETVSQKDRFFILKSLTVEDLESSVGTGSWATQSHNEETLNNAFESADNVYLVFSANKSGEYFGYARMTSPINEDPAAAIEFAPKILAASDVDLPKAIPTEATDFAPRGRIIDDSARGTIFWEAERDETPDASGGDPEEAGSTGDGEDSSNGEVGQDGGETKAWGKPFKLEWLSTAKLPFYRTRGLRNPWNSNREVKIARDGTELEPSVGRRLIGLFNRVQSPIPVVVGGGGMPMRQAIPVMPGYPPYPQ